uniref:Ankyrin repeat protein RF_0381 n=1 Tax=Hirondellea gigas TaxID=1518452 RepID=A0A2P2I0H6_9CRUS
MEDDIVNQLIECLPPDESYGKQYNKLIKAFKECDVDCLKHFIKLGINLNSELFDGHSPLTLLIATTTSNMWQDIAKLFLENGASPNKRSPKGTTVLSLLVADGAPDLVSLALDKGAEIEAVGASGETAVISAVHYKKVPCLKVLLDRGANPNVLTKEGNTAVMWAASRSNGIGAPKCLAAVKLLLQYGADPSRCNNRGYTPLMNASLIRETESVRALLAAGAHTEAVDFRGETALFKAVYSNCVETVIILIKAGANVNARCKIERTPLMVNNSYSILNILLQNDSDTNAADVDGYTPLHHCAISNKPQFLRVLTLHGARINTRCNLGNTPLQIAIRSRSVDCVNYLLSKGANVSTKNDMDVTLFHELIIPWDFFQSVNVFSIVNTPSLVQEIQNYLAPVSDTNLEMVKELMTKGGDCDIPSVGGVSPLMLAALCGDLNLCRFLLSEGSADPHLVDEDGRSVLCYACRGGHSSIVRLLMQKDCVVNSADKNGNLAIFYAAQFSNMGIVDLLILDLAFYMCYTFKKQQNGPFES